MFPYGYGFGGMGGVSQVDELTADSPKPELWAEVESLRKKVKDAEFAAAEAEKKSQDLLLHSQALADKPILILRGATSEQDLNQVAALWRQRHPSGAVLALPPEMALESLSDDDLRACGLKRSRAGAAGERDDYEDMLRGR